MVPIIYIYIYIYITLLINVDRHIKMLPTYCLYFNCGKFPEKAHELELNEKKSRQARENKSRKDDTGT